MNIEFESDKPNRLCKFILVTNFCYDNNVIHQVWNFPVIDYLIHDMYNKIGVWKIKTLKN